METFQYYCNHCCYYVETRGPWPYVDSSDQIQGLMALVFCPTCDKTKRYMIVRYGKPLPSPADIWLSDIPRKTKTVCHSCRSPVYFIIPESVVCPRCHKGTFEVIGPFREDLDRSPVPPPQTPLRVRQNGQTIRMDDPSF